MISEKVITIPLDVVQRSSGEKIKTANAQLKRTKGPGSSSIALVCACEEGMFEAQLTSTRIRRAKTKEDLESSQWLEMVNWLLSVHDGENKNEQARPSHISLKARLDSSEVYDKKGALLGEELAEQSPVLRLLVTTDDVLAITYGSFEMQLIDMEGLTPEKQADVNLLSWLSIATGQEQRQAREISELQARIAMLEETVDVKEAEIEEMTSDYKMIICDLEDRFFQALNSKRRRIAELENDEVAAADLSELNQVFLKRNETNLNRVHIEDIIIGNEYDNYAEAKKKATRSGSKRKASPVKVEEFDGPKRESSPPDNEPEPAVLQAPMSDTTDYSDETDASAQESDAKSGNEESGEKSSSANETEYSE